MEKSRSGPKGQIPVKLDSATHEAVRHYGALFQESQARFMARAVLYFAVNNKELIDTKVEEFTARTSAINQELHDHIASYRPLTPEE